jgi:NAD(P)-dependent dehydrogenase (short-subunit alcohol dehydrogenase family)
MPLSWAGRTEALPPNRTHDGYTDFWRSLTSANRPFDLRRAASARSRPSIIAGPSRSARPAVPVTVRGDLALISPFLQEWPAQDDFAAARPGRAESRSVPACAAGLCEIRLILDIVINNAGIIQVGPVQAAQLSHYEDAVQTMALAPVRLALTACRSCSVGAMAGSSRSRRSAVSSASRTCCPKAPPSSLPSDSPKGRAPNSAAAR